MLMEAVEMEVQEFLSRHSHLKDRKNRQRVVRNGYLPERTIQTEPVRRLQEGSSPGLLPDLDAADGPMESLSIAGRIVRHARSLVLKLAANGDSLDFLTRIRGQCHVLFCPA